MIWFKVLSLLVPFFLCFTFGHDTCTELDSRPVRLSLHSLKNQTGHQLIQVLVEQAADSKRHVPLRIDLDQGCSAHLSTKTRYIKATIIVPPEPATDYVFYPGVGYYKYHSTPMTWEKAFITCQQEGAFLAVTNSDQEEQVLKTLIASNSGEKGSAYLGASDIVEEGKFVTIFGKDLATTRYAKWDTGEPNNGLASNTNPGQDCLVMRKSGLLDDVFCSTEYHFICERQLEEFQ